MSFCVYETANTNTLLPTILYTMLQSLIEKKSDIVYFDQGVTKRCRLSWLTNSSIHESKCRGGGGGAGFPTMSTAVHMEPKRRKIGVIESNQCHMSLSKNWPVKWLYGRCLSVWALRPPPLLWPLSLETVDDHFFAKQRKPKDYIC